MSRGQTEVIRTKLRLRERDGLERYYLNDRDRFFNLDEDMMCQYRWAGYVTYRFRTKEYVAETGYPRFDEILVAIAIDERASFPGSNVPSCLE
ncbi:MAG: hypothetical protein IKM91_02490 [Candidatus Methanomethylophilaceae archaeon]|jgi:hypothetical protein|nr:hypothetical protein [Candidatus Methanomethylophilaceae archaeon]